MGSRLFAHLPRRDRSQVWELLRVLAGRGQDTTSWREGEVVDVLGFVFDRHRAPQSPNEWRARLALDLNAQYTRLVSDARLRNVRDGHVVIKGEVVRAGAEDRPALLRVTDIVAISAGAD